MTKNDCCIFPHVLTKRTQKKVFTLIGIQIPIKSFHFDKEGRLGILICSNSDGRLGEVYLYFYKEKLGGGEWDKKGFNHAC